MQILLFSDVYSVLSLYFHLTEMCTFIHFSYSNFYFNLLKDQNNFCSKSFRKLSAIDQNGLLQLVAIKISL